jgi:ribosomal protein S18 acetylase RimI-like enzyme
MAYTISFRKVEDIDLDFLIKLRKISMAKHLAYSGLVMTNESHIKSVKKSFYESQIILRDRKPIGLIKMAVVALNNTTKSLHIKQFQILPNYQNKGIGSYVLMVLKKRALLMQLPITLNVLKRNPAKTLYIRNGFQIEGKTKLEFKMRCPLKSIVSSFS